MFCDLAAAAAADAAAAAAAAAPDDAAASAARRPGVRTGLPLEVVVSTVLAGGGSSRPHTSEDAKKRDARERRGHSRGHL